MVDVDDFTGTTSPGYVVFKTGPAVLHYRWFYHWLRSPFGERFIKGLTRGAVRERLQFRRPSKALVDIPDIESQRRVADSIPLVRAAVNKAEEKIDAIEYLPAAFLRRAFSGQL